MCILSCVPLTGYIIECSNTEALNLDTQIVHLFSIGIAFMIHFANLTHPNTQDLFDKFEIGL